MHGIDIFRLESYKVEQRFLTHRGGGQNRHAWAGDSAGKPVLLMCYPVFRMSVSRATFYFVSTDWVLIERAIWTREDDYAVVNQRILGDRQRCEEDMILYMLKNA